MMTFPRKLGLLAIVVAVLAGLSHRQGLALPSLRWFFSFEAPNEKVIAAEKTEVAGVELDLPWLYEHQAEIVGYTLCGLIGLIGLFALATGGRFRWNPLTLRKMKRFRSIGRGYRSLKLLAVLVVLALFDQALVGKRALAVHHDGRWVFPAFEQRIYLEEDFGGEGQEEVDYRELKERLAESDEGGRVILPPVPWDPTFDSDEVMRRVLYNRDGVLYPENGRQPYTGYAISHQGGDPSLLVRAGSVRQGKLHGPVQVFGAEGEAIGREPSEPWLGRPEAR